MYVRSFIGVSSVAFCSVLIMRSHVSSMMNRQISDMMERLKKVERDGYQWHSLPGIETVTGPKKEDGTSEDQKDQKDKTEKRSI